MCTLRIKDISKSVVRIVYLALLLAYSDRSRAQEPGTRNYTSWSAADSVAVISLLNKASGFQNTNPDCMIALADSALRQSRQRGFLTGTGWALSVLATGYRNNGSYRKSIMLYKEALILLERQRWHREFYLSATWNALFGAYFPLGMYDSAARCSYQVIDLYKVSGGRSAKPPAGDVYPLIDAYQNLGICWMQLGYYQYALHYIEKAEQLSLQQKNRYRLPDILNCKGALYLEKKMPDSALAVTQRGITLTLAGRDTIRYESLRVNEAAALLQQKQAGKSIAILEETLTRMKGWKITKDIPENAAYLLADAYTREGRYPDALAVLLPALRKATRSGLRYNAVTPHQTLARIYSALGQHRKAYEQVTLAKALSDSMINNDKIQAINLMDIALQTADKDREIIRQENRIQQKNIWIGAVCVSTFLLLLLIWLLYRSNKQKQRLQEERIHNMRREQEITGLKSVMKGEEQERTRFAKELHDGFIGQLSVIKMNLSALPVPLMEPQPLREHIQLLEETIEDLRKTAHNLMPEVLLHRGFIEAVPLYCERMSAAYHLPIEFQFFGTYSQPDKEFELSLYRMVQEGVQNIIKHAKATHAIVQVSCNEDILAITIEDNGIGIGGDTARRGKGAGLENLANRAKGLNGTLTITSPEDMGTSLYFEFDLNQS